MNHHASPAFWACYIELPERVRAIADKSFELLRQDARHPSLHFKRVGRYWSVRVGSDYRALAIAIEDGFLWFWIGTHSDYDRLIR